ncbi:hypothetical protein MMC22_004923 [Lobaria immixta]|nr:hypothetical protein [Lobaria immixta]
MRAAILTFGLTILTLRVSGYPLPRSSDEGSMEMTSGGTLDQVPGLTRRKYLTAEVGPGSPGYGIGVFSVSSDPPASPPIQRIPSTAPTTPSSQPVNQPAVNPPVVNPQPETPATPPVTENPVPIPAPIPFSWSKSAVDQIRRADCFRWVRGPDEYNARPAYCDPNGSGRLIGN